MHAEPLLSWATLFGFLFALARIAGVFAFLPLAAFRAGPDQARIVLAIAFTLLLRPEWHTTADNALSLGRMVTGLAAEATLGLVVGVAMSIVLEVFQMAAQVLSLQAGFGYASMIDPSTGADSTVLISLAQLTAGLIFFASGADRLLVRALADSMRLLPPESFTPHAGWANAITIFFGRIFVVGLKLAMPIIATMLLVDVSLAVIGRVQAQLPLVILTIPAKLLISVLMLSLIIGWQPRTFESMMADAMRLVEGILRSPRAVP